MGLKYVFSLYRFASSGRSGLLQKIIPPFYPTHPRPHIAKRASWPQTPDVPSSRWEGLLAPRRAEGRESTRAGSPSTQSPQALAARPALCWHIPQLSPGHLFPKNPFRASSSLRIQQREQLVWRQQGKPCKRSFVREEIRL